MSLFLVAQTHFTSMIVMLGRLMLLKRGLQNMVIREQLKNYKDDDVRKAAMWNNLFWIIYGGIK